MKIKPSQALSIIPKCFKAGLVPMIEGSPGTGKSTIMHQIAKTYNLKLIDLRLSQCDPTDLLGYPRIKNDRAGYAAMETFPIEGDPLPAGYNGWLLFLDEINSAKEAVQAAAYKLVLNRMVGQHKLHSNVAIAAAGNLETDNAIVEPMSTAMQSRMIWFELVIDAKEWTDWASSSLIDSRITSYINWKPKNISTFDPNHTDKTYACPRTWEFAHNILRISDIGEDDCLPMLAGTLSEGVAREFVGFCKIYGNLPKLEAIMSNPAGIAMPNEPSILYAITGALGDNATESNLSTLVKFILRMPMEFQVICLREIVNRNKQMIAHPTINEWTSSTGIEYF